MRKAKVPATFADDVMTSPPMTVDAARDELRRLATVIGQQDAKRLAAAVDTSMVAATLGAVVTLQNWFRSYAAALQQRRAQ
jgi:hypothetical protein